MKIQSVLICEKYKSGELTYEQAIHELKKYCPRRGLSKQARQAMKAKKMTAQS